MQWKDAAGREWFAKCTIGIAMELKNLGIDLMNPEQLAKIYSDPLEFLKLGVKLHREQMQEHGVCELDMLDVMTSAVEISEASLKAVEAALIDFFHRMRGGKPLAAVLVRAAEAATRTQDAQVEMLKSAKADTAINALINQAIQPLADKLDQLGSPQPNGEASTQQPVS
jgi:hypothetical protein